MFTHPDLELTLAKYHARDLIEEADRHRLAAAVRRRRGRKWPKSRASGRE